ncbi:hypothetical protein A6A19_03195 [Actinobacillus delphinicola]|uniref:peptidylprolyl isomerase n=1 Tax=Actinobacillus delphinicola TaxID=51161 RepID=UPI0024427298|nr:peptidylprolyl isomerase [Actinobacillus delphinicola]MDG6897029.1 hypothetical protein [Actinobacillus delphinicola]
MLMEKIGDSANSLASRILLGFIAVTFVLSGVAGYVFSRTDTYAVKVNGQEISQQSFQQRFNNAYQEISQRLGNQFAAVADSPDFNKNLRNNVLNQLIDQTLLNQYADQLKLGISKRQIETAIVMNPEFKQDGKFNNDLYLQVLKINGLTPDYYAHIVYNNLLLGQLQNGILGSNFVVPALADTLAKNFYQTRQIRVADISTDALMSKVPVTDAEIKAYYDAHQAEFTVPEQVKVQYIDLTHQDVAKNINVTDVQIAQYYQDNLAQYTQQRVAHIQVPTKEEADKIYQELLNGADFATLAKEYSKDTLSAKNGGDLSWITPGMMPKAFEDAAIQLKAGQFSLPVKVDNAYHIIKVEEEKVQPLSDVKDEIATKLRNELALNAFYSTEKKLSDTAFGTTDNLDSVGKELNLPVHETTLFSRQDVPAALNYGSVVTALFNSDITQGGMNSEAISVGDQHSIVVRVLQHKAAGVRTLDEAKADITHLIQQQKAQAIAFQNAEKIATDLNANKPMPADVQFGKDETLSFSNTSQPDLTQAVFALPKSDKPMYYAVKMPAGEVKLVELEKVTDPALTPEQQKAFTQQVQQAKLMALNTLLVKALREHAEIKVNKDFMQAE